MSNMFDAVGLRAPCTRRYTELEYEFEPVSGTLWGFMKQRGNACFNLGILKDIRDHDEALSANGGCVDFEGTLQRVNWYVAASRVPKVFNLGGDLALFLLLIKARDRDALAHYARLCIDNVYARITNYGCPNVTTISLVQGDALGGGFETALSSDVIIAEESAQMGLPEIIFNLFPGMRAAEDLILSGRVLSAAKLHEMGVVDVLAKDGEGETAVHAWIAANAKRRNGLQGVLRSRQHVFPITRAELDAIGDTWVDCALRLEDRDLRMMGRVVRAQMRRLEEGGVTDIIAEAEALAAAG